ncbi:MAG: hypothetical protein H6Q53_940 [Deltaproteobacteria bacterium]|nr:hypothetical protein [Deltaproteobacteria bacterium]
MARHGGGFKSDKRRKELLRLQKQEEKRQRRFSGKTDQESDTGESDLGEPGTDELVTEESSTGEQIQENDNEDAK